MVMPKDPVNKPRTAGPKTNMGPENIPTKPKGIKPQGGGFVNTPTKPKGTKPQGGGFGTGGTRPKGIKPVGRPPKGIKPILLGVDMPVKPVNSGPKKINMGSALLKTMMAKGGMAKKGKK